MQFEYLVIGNGLIGAACFQHLARVSDSVVLVGSCYGELNQYYSSHEDDSRMVRHYHDDEYWQKLVQENFIELEAIESICHEKIFEEMPIYYHFGDDKIEHPFLARIEAGDGNGAGDASTTYGGYQYKDIKGGIIKPKQYIKVMNRVAYTCGGSIVNDVVVGLASKAGYVLVTTSSGKEFRVKNIIKACGVHLNPLPKSVRIVRKILVYVTERLEMDSETYCFVDSQCVSGSPFSDFYGFKRYKLDGEGVVSKFGATEISPHYLTSQQDVSEWFQFAYKEYSHKHEICDLINSYVPMKKDISFKPCAFTVSDSLKPVILDKNNILTITACNGMAAKCPQALAKKILSEAGLL